MLGWRSSAFSPMPSCGGLGRIVNGLAAKTSSPPKNAPKPSSTAGAYGATSRSCRRGGERERGGPRDNKPRQKRKGAPRRRPPPPHPQKHPRVAQGNDP